MFPEYVKNNLFVAKLLSEYESVAIHRNTRRPIISFPRYEGEFTKEYKSFLAGNTTQITSEEWKREFLLAKKSSGVHSGYDLQVFNEYDEVELFAYNLTKTYSSLDRYRYIGTINASVGVGAAEDYDNSFVTVNRFGAIISGQLQKVGDTQSYGIAGYMTFSPDNPQLFMAKPLGSTAVLDGNHIVISTGLEDTEDPPVAPTGTGVGAPTVLNKNVSTDQGVGINVDLPVGSTTTSPATIDATTTILRDVNNSSNIGNSTTLLYVSGIGNFSVTSAGLMTYNPDANFSGIAQVYYRMKDSNGVYSNWGVVSITVNVTSVTEGG